MLRLFTGTQRGSSFQSVPAHFSRRLAPPSPNRMAAQTSVAVRAPSRMNSIVGAHVGVSYFFFFFQVASCDFHLNNATVKRFGSEPLHYFPLFHSPVTTPPPLGPRAPQRF